MRERFVLYNKTFYKATDSFLTSSLLDDFLFFVEMKLANTKLLFWEEYQEIIMLYFRFYGVDIDSPMRLMKDIERQIQRSYVKNKLYKGAVVRLSFFQVEEMLTYMIELNHVNRDVYTKSTDVIELIENARFYKSRTLLSSLSIGCRDLWRVAKAACIHNRKQIPLIVDEKNNILETPNANLFLIFDNQKVKTPHISLGICVNPARQFVIILLQDLGYEVEEVKELTTSDLLQAIEVFTANDLIGIRTITAFKHARYYRTQGNIIAEEFLKALLV
ncbi:MAG: aminotransferase class IV [Mangrovibacterium sp.]